MTDTPKDRDMDEAVEVMARARADKQIDSNWGTDVPPDKRERAIDLGWPSFSGACRAELAALRSAGYLVAPEVSVADDGLREAINSIVLRAWETARQSDVSDAILPLIHAREAALRAERDAALAALAEAEKRCETMREALDRAAEEIFGNGLTAENTELWLDLSRRARAAAGAEGARDAS